MKKLNHRKAVLAIILLVFAAVTNWGKLKNHVVSASRTLAATESSIPQAAGNKNPSRISESYGRLPMSFELNRGQADPHVKYLARGRGYQVLLTESEAILRLQGVNRDGAPGRLGDGAARRLGAGEDSRSADLLVKLDGASPASQVIGLDSLPGKSNYLIGNDPDKWHKDIPNYARVEYRDVYPGVNLAYYGTQRALEYDFIVTPGYDPGVITVRFEGVDRLEMNDNGALALHVNGETIYQRSPVIYQRSGGGRRPVSGRYVMKGERQIGFEVKEYDRSKPLVIDPVLEYGTYLGGGGDDMGQSVKVDGLGAAYVAGVTAATDFTAKSAAQPLNKGKTDAFVTKLSASGDTIIYSTYLGGGGNDTAYGIAVGSDGSAYVTGNTTSSDFNTLNPLQPANRGGSDAFVAKINSTGSQLVFSTYLGGGDADVGSGIAVDSSGAAYVTGYTASNNFTTAPAPPLQASNRGGLDAFVTKINAAGSALTYSTYLGGSGADSGSSIVVDSLGNAYVTGNTESTDFNTFTPRQATNAGGVDLFVAKINPAGANLVFSTYLGGSGDDQGFGLAIDSARNVYLTGSTSSNNFPVTSNTFQPMLKGVANAFVTKMNAAGTQLTYSTYLGGGIADTGRSVAVDAANNCYVVGEASSTDFPLKDPLQPANRGISDAFVAKLNPAGNGLVFATYLGGGNLDAGLGVAIDADSNVYVTGSTTSLDFDVVNAPQNNNLGGADAFVTKISSDGQQMSYSTYLGGSGNDSGLSVAVDGAGNAYLTGSTAAANFEVKNPVQSGNRGASDAFVVKLDPAGQSLVYSTYLGGSGLDQGLGIAVDQAGAAYLTGVTASTDFNTRQPLRATNGGGGDAFIAKLNAAGNDLVYSTYFGGGGNDAGAGIAVDGAGAVYITGTTGSTNLPTQSPLQPNNRGAEDAFIAKINAAGSQVVYATYLGGAGSDSGSAIALDASGAAYVTGVTASTDFNTKSPLQATNRGELDAFVAKISSDGSALSYSSYLGGGGTEFGNSIAVDSSGNAYVAGSTASTNFTTVNPLQNANRGGFDAFITKINPSGSAAVYSTYLGGADSDAASGVAVDASGIVYLTGNTSSSNFPLKNQAQDTNGGRGDAFISAVNAAGSDLIYSTYIGGSDADSGSDIAVDGGGNVYVVGQTASIDLPIANPLQPSAGGGFDSFIFKISGVGVGAINSVSAATFAAGDLAPELITAAFGGRLATMTALATDTDPGTPGIQLPTNLMGTTVSFRDSQGMNRLAPLLFVSSGQVNYISPAGTALGAATVTITSGDGSVSIGNVTIAAVAPGIFTANSNGRGVPSAYAIRGKPSGQQTFEPILTFDSAANAFVPLPIDLGPDGDVVVVVLFGTGWRAAAGDPNNRATINGVDATPNLFLGAQGDFAGLDQANVFLPRSLAGVGEVDLVLTAAGKPANTVRIKIK